MRRGNYEDQTESRAEQDYTERRMLEDAHPARRAAWQIMLVALYLQAQEQDRAMAARWASRAVA